MVQTAEEPARCQARSWKCYIAVDMDGRSDTPICLRPTIPTKPKYEESDVNDDTGGSSVQVPPHRAASSSGIFSALVSTKCMSWPDTGLTQYARQQS